MTELPSDLDARSFFARYEQGDLPREFVFLAAKGFLPLPQDQLVEILAFLSVSDDAEVAAAAHESLAEQPLRVLQAFARDQDTDPANLDRLARSVSDAAVLEPILRNRQTTDATILHLASTVSGHLQEVIVINHERLLRAPEIIEALENNPNLTTDVRRRVVEMREEYFQKKRIEDVIIGAHEEAADEYDLTEEEKAEFADLLAEAERAEHEAAPIPGDPDEEIEANESAWTKVQNMTISQRVRCALKGGRTERSILIKDRNRLVASAVIRSPRISESEVEAYAGMRNIEEEALRMIGMKRDWMQKYPLMLALVKNPKAPIGVVLPLINRLNLRDLKTLSGDKGVSDAVRQSSRRLYNQRKKT
ncbi:MAG: hypothetical protein ABR517_00145 [Thermoanaerobaculia bacterium]